MTRDPMHQSPSKTLSLFVFSFFFTLSLMIPGSGTAGSSESELVSGQDLISKVDRTELERIVRDLSGANEIEVWGLPFRLSTRYALTLGKEIACQYLVDEIRAIGYEPVLQQFALSVRPLYLTSLAISGGGDSVFVGDVYGRVFTAVSSDDFQQYDMQGQLDGEIYDFEIDPIADPPGTIWAACGLPGGGFGAVFRSSDGGLTWEEVHSGSQVMTLQTITMSGGRGVAAGSSGSVVLAIYV